MGNYILYGLRDPRDGKVFYIGKSEHGMKEANRHTKLWHVKKDKNLDKVRKIAQIMCAGFEVEVIKIADFKSRKQLCYAETSTIRTWTRAGFQLTNRLNNVGEL